MTGLIANLLLALAWMLLQGRLAARDFLAGYIGGFILLYFWRRSFPDTGYFDRVRGIVVYLLVFLRELVLANLQVAKVVLSPRPNLQPGIIAVPLEVQSDWGITLLADTSTLTPGTLTVEISPDKRTLYVHAMQVNHPEELRRQIKQVLERAVLGVTR